MAEVVNLGTYRTRLQPARGRRADPIITEIVDALAALGGAAHRRAIAAQVFTARTGSMRSPTRDVELEIYQALEAYAAGVKQRRSPSLIERPLGDGSYRWALAPAGEALVHPPRAPLSRPELIPVALSRA